MTSFNLHYLLRALSSDTVMLGLWASPKEFEGHTVHPNGQHWAWLSWACDTIYAVKIWKYWSMEDSIFLVLSKHFPPPRKGWIGDLLGNRAVSAFERKGQLSCCLSNSGKNSVSFFLSFFFFFFNLWPCLGHVEVPGPGIESEPQLGPMPHSLGNTEPLTHCSGQGIKPTPPWQPELLELDS